MTVHRIRLRGPWELKPITADSLSRRVRLPARWSELFETGIGRVELSRRFHRPTNLEPGDVVSLVFDDLPAGARVSLNGASLDPQPQQGSQSAAFPTPRLEPSNLVTLEFDAAAQQASGDPMWGEVALIVSSS